MSQSRPILKIAAVSAFVILMSSFVAYRSGAFDRYLDNTAIALPGEAGKTDSPAVDSPKNADVIMPSSKSGKVIEPRPVQNAAPQKDTTPRKQANANNNNQDVAPLIIPSSKSGPVFVPKTQAPAPTGATGTSGATAATGTTAPTGATGPTFMHSTKSAPVFTPSPGNDTPAPKKKKKKNPK